MAALIAEQYSAMLNEITDSTQEKTNRSITFTNNEYSSVKSNIDKMFSIRHKIQTIAELILELSDFVQSISSTIGLVEDIAEQTNLLALNAAVEAARAGEHGKGFAVVASEIRKLADESNQAAQKINELIAGIMQNSREAVEAMKEGAEEVVNGAELVNEAGGTFNNIVNMVNSISEESNTMSTIVEQLSGGTDTIARNIHEIEQMSIAVADETSNVSAASQEQTASSYEVAQASEKLSGNAQELQSFVARFSL